MSGIKIRTQAMGDFVELKLLLSHPMENGRNREPLTGELIPPHFIQELSILLNGTLIIQIDMAGSIAANPYFSFRLKTARTGDTISVRWLDNLGISNSADVVVKLD